MVKKYKQISINVLNRLKKEVGQKGGSAGLRENQFSSDGTFINMVTQLSYMIENGVSSIIDGVGAIKSVVTLPSDFMSITEKPNEPLPTNTPIYKAIDII